MTVIKELRLIAENGNRVFTSHQELQMQLLFFNLKEFLYTLSMAKVYSVK